MGVVVRVVVRVVVLRVVLREEEVVLREELDVVLRVVG